MKKALIKNLSFLFIILSTLILLSCSNTSKKNTVLEVTKLSNSVYQDDKYILPSEVNIKISDKEILIPITWNNENIDTSNPGIFTYEGYNDEFGSKVIMELTVLETTWDKQMGYIKKIYKEKNKTYIDVDLIEFYNGDEALKEAIKDNKAIQDDDGSYYMFPNYYIRNDDEKITTYEISDNCILKLLSFDLDPYSSSIPELINVDYDTFATHINKGSSLPFNIDIKNNSAYAVYKKFLP